jgi:hypothetical protein
MPNGEYLRLVQEMKEILGIMVSHLSLNDEVS